MDILSRTQKKLLPHISRIFSASGQFPQFRFVLLASFLAFVVLNVWMWYMMPKEFSLERINLLSAPLSSNRHIEFGKQLYLKGNAEEAVFEVTLARQVAELPQPFSLLTPIVLGAQTEPNDLLDAWEQRRTYTLRSYQFWKTVIADKSEYRDAYIALTVLCMRMDKRDEAVVYLTHAYGLDPNNGYVKDLAMQLGVSL